MAPSDLVRATSYTACWSMAPSVLSRPCVCNSAGRTLCGVCALSQWVKNFPTGYTGRAFSISSAQFLRRMRRDASAVGVCMANRLGSHAWRRGMAQDIVTSGGSLATLLRAGQWRSRSFMVYLQEQTLNEQAVAQLIIDHSEDELE